MKISVCFNSSSILYLFGWCSLHGHSHGTQHIYCAPLRHCVCKNYQWQHNMEDLAFNLTFRYIDEVDSIIIETWLIWSLYKYRQITYDNRNNSSVWRMSCHFTHVAIFLFYEKRDDFNFTIMIFLSPELNQDFLKASFNVILQNVFHKIWTPCWKRLCDLQPDDEIW